MSKRIITQDKYALYLCSVQDPLSDVERISNIYTELTEKNPEKLREDFSGTFALCCCWVQDEKNNSAIAIDIDENALSYGKENYYTHLSDDEKKRLNVLQQDSISTTEKVDIIVAFNYSYCLFHQRSVLKQYFKHCLDSLDKDGILILDLFGGSDSEILETQVRQIHNNDQIQNFDFEFVRESFNPISRKSHYHINFKYEDGPSIEKAFSYHFRMWTIPELRELMEEVGFSKSVVFWEGIGDDGFGNGEFHQSETEENTVNWNAFIVGAK
ncbi:MAG: class I SAM-dependent methyltransferase [Bacteriovoracaceae bacterium]|jgi:SAM-dependent methyltransferase|nr:class I SAM-dependent methyltransferase [Bacteriovoracaceae bacterium]